MRFLRVPVALWLIAQIGLVDANADSRIGGLEQRVTRLEETLKKFISVFASRQEPASKGDHHVVKRQAVVEEERDLEDVLSEISVNGVVTLLRGRDGLDGHDGSPGIPGSPGAQGPRGPEGNCSNICEALPAPYHKIWRQGDIDNFLKVTNLPAMSQMTACFYFKPSHIGHAGTVTFHQRALMSIASNSNANEFVLAFHGDRSHDLRLAGEPQTNTLTYGLEAAFSEAHRHCFVWNDGSYLKWFYDSDTPGVLELAGQVVDSGISRIPAGSTLVLLNEQDSKGGGLDTRQMIAGDIADFQMWDRAFSNSQVRALGCAEVGNVVTFDDIIPVGLSHFHRDTTFQCSNIN